MCPNPETEKVTPQEVYDASEPWSRLIGAVSAGKWSKACSRIVKENGSEVISDALEGYITDMKAKGKEDYMSFANFAERWKQYRVNVTPETDRSAW